MNRKQKALAVCVVFLAAAIVASELSYTFAQSYIFELSPYFDYGLTGYNTKIATSNYLYCNTFAWNDANATELDFTHVSMVGGIYMAKLNVSVINGNLTFNSLGLAGTNFDLENSGSPVNVTLAGFGSEPNKFEVDGSTFHNYTYTSSSDRLTFTTSGSNVKLEFSGFTIDDAVAIGLVGMLIAIAVCIALIYVWRTKQ